MPTTFTVEPREFVRRYIDPHLLTEPEDSEDPRPVIVELMAENKTKEVISRFDVSEPRSYPGDNRVLVGLIGAHIQAGNMDRAKALCEHSLAVFRSLGDRHREATVFAQRARIAFREEGFEAAQVWHQKAWDTDERCLTAWANALAYASVDQLLSQLESSVAKFVVAVPDFGRNPHLVTFFREDAQLAWARRQATFKREIIARLSN